ncbi:hypothetical protein AOLI_G00249340 [Acnodon oligacanthus]
MGCHLLLLKLLPVLFSILEDNLQLPPAGKVQVDQGFDGLLHCGDSLVVLASSSRVSAPLLHCCNPDNGARDSLVVLNAQADYTRTNRCFIGRILHLLDPPPPPHCFQI